MTSSVDSAGSASKSETTTSVESGGLSAADKSAVTAASDSVTKSEVEQEAAALTGPEVDAFETTSKPNPASVLSDTTLTGAQMSERLSKMSTPELTETVRGLDTMEMDFSKSVTPQGWDALHSEISDRFTAASKAKDYSNPELAELSLATTRQGQFGEKSAPWSEKSWRELATATTNIDRRDPQNTTAAKAYESLSTANRIQNHRVAGRVPAELMTNAQLLAETKGLPQKKAVADIVGLSMVGMFAPDMANARASEVVGEIEKRTNAGQMLGYDAMAATTGSLGAIAETAAMINPRNIVKKGARALGKRADGLMTARDARISGALRDVMRGKGNFDIGELSRFEAIQAGRAFVGPGFTKTVGRKGEIILESADKTRRYRHFSHKSRQGGQSANFESLRLGDFKSNYRSRNWEVNGHASLRP